MLRSTNAEPGLAALLPPWAAVVDSVLDEEASDLFPEEAAALGERAVAKRRREFAAGRHCAHRALQALGAPEMPVGVGARGEPLWPAGVVGSITHASGYAAAAAALAADAIALGIDAETRTPLSPEIEMLVTTAAERRDARRRGLDRHWAAIVFSAKESVYKAWYPHARCWLGFHDVEIEIAPDEAALHARVVARDAPRGDLVALLRGHYCVSDGRILTAFVA